MRRYVNLCIGIAISVTCPLASAATAGVVEISDVPSYEWYRGCGPTAGGMVMGYWDGQGYEDLVTGSNSWATNEANVKAMIASQEHYDDYWDADAPPPHHADNCVADFMGTSRDPKGNGQTAENNLYFGMVEYAKYRGYEHANGWYSPFGGLWDIFVAEIDADRPMVFAVDTNGDGDANHCVTVFGYDDTDGAERYYYYDPNYLDDQRDAAFQPVGHTFGISSGTWFNPVPEPATIGLLAVGSAVRVLRRRRT
jgi:hypothetical protein